MSHHCETEKLLKVAGVEENFNRKMVLDILTHAKVALSPKTLLDELRSTTLFDKVTLYRILDLLVEKKIVRRIAGINGSMLYEILCEEHHPLHAHFICRDCGTMECLENTSINNLIKKIQRERKADDENVDLRFEGVCGICRPNKKRGKHGASK